MILYRWEKKENFTLTQLAIFPCNKMFHVELNEVTRPINHFTRRSSGWRGGDEKEKKSKRRYKISNLGSKRFRYKVDL